MGEGERLPFEDGLCLVGECAEVESYTATLQDVGVH